MRWITVLAALALAGCGARAQPGAYPMRVEAREIPLSRAEPGAQRVGALAYAGGLSLEGRGTDSFGGLSGLDVAEDGRFVAVTDTGDLVRGRLALDGAGRLSGVAEATITRLQDERGGTLQGKAAADAEDVSFADGGVVVSFEQRHRLVLYPAAGAPRRLGSPPTEGLANNAGFEAVAAWRDAAGRRRLLVGAESGDAWDCDGEGEDCRQVLHAERDNPGSGFRLTGLDALPDGGFVAVYRDVVIPFGFRAAIAEIRLGEARPVRELARLGLSFGVDNLEGIAAVRHGDAVRLYLVSDDNFSRLQRTTLLAFDWTR